MIKHSNSQIITVFFCENKFLLCYCDANMNESHPELLRNLLIIISHNHCAEQTKS